MVSIVETYTKQVTEYQVAGIMVYIKITGIWNELFSSILIYCCVGDICMVSAKKARGFNCTD
jgi:hypothetical protein